MHEEATGVDYKYSGRDRLGRVLVWVGSCSWSRDAGDGGEAGHFAGTLMLGLVKADANCRNEGEVDAGSNVDLVLELLVRDSFAQITEPMGELTV